MRALKTKLYLSDEGYGHIVRQRAVLEALQDLDPNLEATLQTDAHFAFAKQHVPAQHFIKKFNNIRWHKMQDSSPDLKAIEKYYLDYEDAVEAYKNSEELDASLDFLLTDFVYEAFDIGQKNGIPVFGVSHFTWDWFFSKLYPRVISDRLFRYFTEQAKSARQLFFPPFTPQDILKFYNKNAMEVPFIIRNEVNHRQWPETEKFKILIMDSGAGLLRQSIQKAIASLSSAEVCIGVMEGAVPEQAGMLSIPRDHLLVDYVKNADLVVGRPGFNTLSECIAYRVPMLLLSESMNPEMEHNIMELKKLRLGAFISKEDFESDFGTFLSSFLLHEYQNLKRYMDNHAFETNGAAIIARELLNRL